MTRLDPRITRAEALVVYILLLCIVGWLLTGCAHQSLPYPQEPPKRFIEGGFPPVVLRIEGDVAAACASVGPNADACAMPTSIGGHGVSTIFMPDPCRFSDPYARTLCHELAHSKGWPGDHPQ